MRRTIFPLALILFLAAGCREAPVEAKEFISETGGFSVVVPATLTEKSQELSSDFNKMTVVTYAGGSDSNRFMVNYMDLTQDVVDAAGAKTILEGSRDQLVGSAGITVLSEAEISLDGNPGQEVVFQTSIAENPQLLVRARIYLVGTRLYQVIAAVPKAYGENEITANFLDSFKLLPR